MSELKPPAKSQYVGDISTPNSPSKSPSKQKFNTFKNFLRNKGSLTDLRVWQDARPRDAVPASLSESKIKDATRKRSLGILMPPTYANSDHEEKIRNGSPTTPKNTHGNLQRHYSSSRRPFTQNTSSNKETSSVELHELYSNPRKTFEQGGSYSYSPQKVSSSTSETFSFAKDWAPADTIKGTYVHDWSNNASPRSLSASQKAGKVEIPAPSGTLPHAQFSQLSNLNNSKMRSESVLSLPLNDSKLLKVPFKIGSAESVEGVGDTSGDSLLNIETIEPSHPLPSPCISSFKNENQDNSFLSSPKSILRTHSTCSNPLLDRQSSYGNVSNSDVDNVNGNGDEDNCDGGDDSEGDGDDDDYDDSNSQKSQFSFMRNRTSSIRFYKSKEQVESERNVDSDRVNQMKLQQFLGTAKEREGNLLDFNSGSRRITDGFDEDVNYNNYDDDDETDALFNRDMFGLNEFNNGGDKPNLELHYDGEGIHTDQNPYEYKAPTGLELELDSPPRTPKNPGHDDVFEYRSTGGLEMDDFDYKPPTVLEIDDFEYKPPTGLEIDDSEYGPPSGLEMKMDDFGCKEPTPLELQKNYPSDQNELESSRDHRDLYEETIPKNTQDEARNQFGLRNKKPVQEEKKAKDASNEILRMLNNSGSDLILRPVTPEISLKHTPSAKTTRHRSLKFHQLPGDIEENISENKSRKIWHNPKALEEVNLIPEDYSSDDEYHRFENPPQARLSTMVIPKSSRTEIISERDGKSKAAGQHLWKNLINNKIDTERSGNPLKVEKIQLNDKTITLYERRSTNETSQGSTECDFTEENVDDSKSTNNDTLELSTIME